MNHFKYVIIPLVIFVSACNSNGISTNEAGQTIFTYEPLNWQMHVPNDWEILTESQRDKLAYKAQNYYEEDVANNKDEKKIILGVRKAEKDINSIYAFIRAYETGDDPPDLKELLQQQYRQYSTDNYTAEKLLQQETIQGKTFDVATLSVNYNGKPYFKYITYSTMLGNTNFGVSIVTNNKADEDMLTNNFIKSIKTIK